MTAAAKEEVLPQRAIKKSGTKNRKRRVPSLLFGLLIALLVMVGILVSNLDDVVVAFIEGYVHLPNIGSASANAPDWDKKERINILLVGIDRRPSEGDAPTRTDTILIATLDPYGKTAGMLSIPRDLWVPIPLSDGSTIYDRINTAYVYGELKKEPGGGASLLENAIEYNLGVKIHYYVIIDFQGFAKIIDTLGGIDVSLEKPLYDPQFPTDDYETMNVYIPAGQQHLNGEKALWYARSRYQEADYGRMRHQQQLLMSIRDKALNVGILPKLPSLWGQFNRAIKTDLSVSEMIRLANIGNDIATDKITTRTIDNNYVTSRTTSQGASVLVPDRAKLEELVNEVFFDARLRAEAARVEILNGTTTPGLAQKMAETLQRRGFQQVTYDNAQDKTDHSQTLLINLSSKKYSASLIADLLGLPSSRIRSQNDPQSSADLRLVLGEDAKLPED
ncbi:MAG: LCP family protein [Chloroflexi bacterium]|nr:LCP family protein [Chloroflexota bacterium]